MKSNSFLLFLLVASCTFTLSNEDLPNLKGYWVIQEAVAPTGEVRFFQEVVEVDFFEWDGNSGFRKKLVPMLNNPFNTSKDKVDFSIAFVEKKCFITYTSPQNEWQEEVVLLNEHHLELKDTRGVLFRYKKYQP